MGIRYHNGWFCWLWQNRLNHASMTAVDAVKITERDRSWRFNRLERRCYPHALHFDTFSRDRAFLLIYS